MSKKQLSFPGQNVRKTRRDNFLKFTLSRIPAKTFASHKNQGVTGTFLKLSRDSPGLIYRDGTHFYRSVPMSRKCPANKTNPRA